MSNIVFYNRDFTRTTPLNAIVELERYSHHMIGGPESATLHIKQNVDKWELTKLLRCPVEIYGADGGMKWWGFVNRVTVPHGRMRVGVGLDELYNSVSIKYLDGTTTAVLDTQSTTEYGTKQFYVDMSGVSQTEANNYSNTYLSTHKYAVPEIELSGGGGDVVVECYGWWKTLGWKYYSNTSTTNIDNALQVSAITTSCGQFIQGVIIEAYAGVTSNPMRDGTNVGLTYIEELLGAGSSNSRPMLAYVDKDRYVHIYERIAENAEYVMREDGNIETLLGRRIEPEQCLTAAWVRVKDVPDILGGISAMRPFFIEHAEYIETDAREATL